MEETNLSLWPITTDVEETVIAIRSSDNSTMKDVSLHCGFGVDFSYVKTTRGQSRVGIGWSIGVDAHDVGYYERRLKANSKKDSG